MRPSSDGPPDAAQDPPEADSRSPSFPSSRLRRMGRHMRDLHATLGPVLPVGLLFAAASLLLFLLLAVLIERGSTLGFDHFLLLWLDARSNPRLDTVALEVTSLGSIYVTGVGLIIASVLLWQTRHRFSAVLLWAAVAGGWGLNPLLKALFDRPRPELFEWRVPHAGRSSYPSGHAMTAMIFYATIAYLLIRLESTRAFKGLTLTFFVVVILLVGVSRVYLGVHYPSDVIGGFFVGFAWAALSAIGIEAIRYRVHRSEVRDQGLGAPRSHSEPVSSHRAVPPGGALTPED